MAADMKLGALLLTALAFNGARAQMGMTCNIGDLFTHLNAIKNNEECRAGCDNNSGQCEGGDDWYPGRSDACNAECGRVRPVLSITNGEGRLILTHCLRITSPDLRTILGRVRRDVDHVGNGWHGRNGFFLRGLP
eukprot:SAG11_NODE_9603_length_896_cov_1.996236_1_plen_135_part_00